MKQAPISFDELLESYESSLREAGFGYAGRLRMLKRAGMLVQWHENAGYKTFNEDIIAAYFKDADQRLYEGKICAGNYRERTRDIRRLLIYTKSGSVELAYPLRGSRYKLTPEFQRIVDDYIASEDFHPNTRNDMRWVANKYFAWLVLQGHEDMSHAGASDLQAFLLDCSKQVATSSMYNIRLFLKKLYRYLYTVGLSESPYTELLSFRVNRESKIYPALPMSDVAKLLDAIDRRTKNGKRKYAVMVLGAELGLRACDVINLKLDNIDWLHGEIRLMQSKTRKSVVLPLTQMVGEALSDYILYSRPQTEERHVFLRYLKPHTPIKDAVTIGDIYRDCCIAAGIPSSNAFHTLRRSLATAMVTGGVEITTVAQVLGDAQINSTKKYIALDSNNLKRCALPFDGILPLGGEML